MKILDYVSAQNWVEQCRTGFHNTSAHTIRGAYEQCVIYPSCRDSKWAILGFLPGAYDTPIWRERAKEIRTKLDNMSIFW